MTSRYFVAFFVLLVGSQARELQVKNVGKQDLKVSGTNLDDVVLAPNEVTTVTVADNWSGSIWGQPNSCNGVCEGPKSLAELTLGTIDYYDVSLIDGFNLPVKITPLGDANCRAAACMADIIALCPPENQVKTSSGEVIACTNSPVLFSTLCPLAIVTPTDDLNVVPCQASSYQVLLG